jgi:hypothetical protein
MPRKNPIQSGDVFGKLTVIERAESIVSGGSKRTRFLCQCACSDKTLVTVMGQSLRSGATKSCGCALSKDRQGAVYGLLTVVRLSHKGKKGEAYWICVCACEERIEVIVRGSHLTDGQTRSCGCIRRLNEVGNTYGQLTVLRLASMSEGAPRDKGYWVCCCTCTEREIVVSGHDLRSGHTTSCGCSRIHKDRDKIARNCIIKQGKANARSRGIGWDLTDEECRILFEAPCFYCAAAGTNTRRAKGKGYEDVYRYSGIDRVDNDQGYHRTNVVPCCIICNRAKMDLTFEDFIDWRIRFGGCKLTRWDVKVCQDSLFKDKPVEVTLFAGAA